MSAASSSWWLAIASATARSNSGTDAATSPRSSTSLASKYWSSARTVSSSRSPASRAASATTGVAPATSPVASSALALASRWRTSAARARATVRVGFAEAAVALVRSSSTPVSAHSSMSPRLPRISPAWPTA